MRPECDVNLAQSREMTVLPPIARWLAITV